MNEKGREREREIERTKTHEMVTGFRIKLNLKLEGKN